LAQDACHFFDLLVLVCLYFLRIEDLEIDFVSMLAWFDVLILRFEADVVLFLVVVGVCITSVTQRLATGPSCPYRLPG
jgi:hypothetical protein